MRRGGQAEGRDAGAAPCSIDTSTAGRGVAGRSPGKAVRPCPLSVPWGRGGLTLNPGSPTRRSSPSSFPAWLVCQSPKPPWGQRLTSVTVALGAPQLLVGASGSPPPPARVPEPLLWSFCVL